MKDWLAYLLSFLFLALITGLWLWGKGMDVWSHTDMEADVTVFFCEHSYLEHLVRQPINTASNVFMLFFGLRMCLWARQQQHEAAEAPNLMQRQPLYAYTYGFTIVLLALFSSFFHAALIHLSQQLDMAGVNCMALFPLFYNLHRLHNIRQRGDSAHTTRGELWRFWGGYILMSTVLTLLKWQLNAIAVIAVLTLLNIALAIYVERQRPGRTNTGYLWACLFLLVLAGTLYIFDIKKILCDEYGWIHPHAVWHIGAGFSAWVCFLYFWTEGQAEAKAAV